METKSSSIPVANPAQTAVPVKPAVGPDQREAGPPESAKLKRLWALFQNLGTLALLALAFPFNLALVLLAQVWTWFKPPCPQSLLNPPKPF